MTCQNCNQMLCICVVSDPVSAIPAPLFNLFDPEKFTEIAQAIFKATSLQPFDPKKPNPGIQRISHGATHHARVAMWVRILANICKANHIGSEEELSERNIKLLQYVALFHDAARENDHGKDIWEEKSAAACKAFLVKNDISEEEAAYFSSLITEKEKLGLLGKILQSADCIDIMRCKKVFHVEKISLYSELEEKEDAVEDYLIPFVKEAGKLIHAQSDMRDDVWVTLHGKKVAAFKKSRDAENLALKEKYELAENCYAEVTADVEKFAWLADLHQGHASPFREEECKEEEKEEEEAYFFEQPEIPSYSLVVQDALPAKENLVQGEIYLHKGGSKLAYIFKTPDGEVAEGKISRREIPLPADFSQEMITEELRHTILQWFLKNETAVIFQKALRADEYMFFGTFIPMVGGDMHDAVYAEEEEEKQDADAEEKEALNKITLRRAREEKKGIYIVKRGNIYISDLDATGKLIWYGTNEDGTSNGIRLAPYYTPEQKRGFSKPQSVSALSDKIPAQRVFGFGREGEKPPVVALFPQRATLSHAYFSRYDAGTVGRPGDFASYAEAKAYRDRKYGGEDPSIRTEQGPFIEDLAAGKNIGNYTEPMMRLKWVDYALFLSASALSEEEQKVLKPGRIHFWREGNKLAYTLRLPSKEVVVAHFDESHLKQMGITLDTLTEKNLLAAEDTLLYALRTREHVIKPCCLGLPENHTLSSRILTQNIAEQIQAYVGKKPRIVYMAAFPKEVIYTEAKQKEDREAAEKIAADPVALSEALDKKDFYFLLGIAPEKLKEILDTHPKAQLIDFYTKGYVDFAKQLALRAGMGLEGLQKIVCGFDWSSEMEVHPVAIQDLALHYLEHYKKLPASHVNAPNAQGSTVLDTAVYFGRLKLAFALLDHGGILVDTRKRAGGRLLVHAMRKGYKNMAQYLLAQGYHNTAFLWAAKDGHVAVVEALLGHRETDPNRVDKNGSTALLWAAQHGYAAMVEALLGHRETDPNLADKKGDTALLWAAKNGHVAAVKALLSHRKTDPNLTDKEGDTALLWAAKNGHVAVVEALLGHRKTAPNFADKKGNTALLWAAKNGHGAVVEALLGHDKTDPNFKNSGYTALIEAAQKGHVAVVEALLGHRKTDPNLAGEWGRTALVFAAQNGRVAVVKALLRHRKTNPNRADKNGDTALLWAAQEGHVAVVEALLGHDKTDPNLAAEDGDTALRQAASRNHLAVAKALLGHDKTDPNLAGKDGDTALRQAASRNHLAVVKALLGHRKTDPNFKNRRGDDTALTAAAAYGHAAVVEALLGHDKTDPNLAGEWGRTALIWATQKGHVAVVEALNRHAAEEKQELQSAVAFSPAAALGNSLSSVLQSPQFASQASAAAHFSQKDSCVMS